MVFNSNEVIVQHFKQATLRSYYVGFDFGAFRLDALTEILMDAIVDFAFGYHTGILRQYDRRKLKEAAKALYNIKEFKDAKETYIDNNEVIDDSIELPDKILKRGEFGELILHVLLRDFLNTIPLLSKIYFKDTDGATVHGFDSVQIGPDLSTPDTYSLFLGESKIYYRKDGKAGEDGVKDLVLDIQEHFNRNFLERECSLIAKRKQSFIPLDEYPDKNTQEEYETFLFEKNHWFEKMKNVCEGKVKLKDFLSSVTIPLVCTYQSKLFENFNDETNPDFISEYEREIKNLEVVFKKALNSIEEQTGEPKRTNLNIVLILFPIPNKKDLIKVLHQKLYNQQNA